MAFDVHAVHDGWKGLRRALIERLPLLLPEQKLERSSNVVTQQQGYVIDLSGHWAVAHVELVTLQKKLTLVLFDSLGTESDAEHLYAAGLTPPQMQAELASVLGRGDVEYRPLLLAPVSLFVPMSSSGGGSVSRVYYAQDDAAPHRRAVIQPILQAKRDNTCLARALAVVCWLLSCGRQFRQRWTSCEFVRSFEQDVFVRNELDDHVYAVVQRDVKNLQGEFDKNTAEASCRSKCREGWGEETEEDACRRVAEQELEWRAEEQELASRDFVSDGDPDKLGKRFYPKIVALNDENFSQSRHEACGSTRTHFLDDNFFDVPKESDDSRCPSPKGSRLREAVKHARNKLVLTSHTLNGCSDASLSFFLYPKIYGKAPNAQFSKVKVRFSVLPFPKHFESMCLDDFVGALDSIRCKMRNWSDGTIQPALDECDFCLEPAYFDMLKSSILRYEEYPEHRCVCVSDYQLPPGPGPNFLDGEPVIKLVSGKQDR